MTRKQAAAYLAVAVVFGVVAAAVVWYLERFETERMFRELRSYLAKYDAFREYEARGDNAGD